DDVFTHSVNHLMVRIEAVEISKRLYMVIDLESGAISYLKDVPEGGWTDEYKTTKMVLRRVKAGTFTMGSPQYESDWRKDYEIQHDVTLTKDFYIGVFETTQKQYKMITGSDPSGQKGDMRPVEAITYNMIRGKEKGSAWPANNDVDEDSFMGKLRAKTSKTFDLPTEAQWEYACRAGTFKAWNNNTDASKEAYHDENLDKLGRYSKNGKDGKGGYDDLHTTVGSYLPNYWGLYDMHGNVWEMCLDWWGDPGSYTSDPVTDPVGAAEGTSRHMRGGSQANPAGECRSAFRAGNGPNDRYEFVGFRVALTVSDDDDDDPDDGPAFAEKYMVVDLASGESSYLDARPEGGWTDEYKTTKMVLRKVEAGKFTMGSPEDELGRYKDEVRHDVTLTKDFYIAVFQTTQKQYETIIGSNPSEYTGDLRPVDSVPYNTIRGTEKGKGWPTNGDVDEDSFLGKLRAKTSKAFDLPTEAQWEFACRAGTTTALNNGTNLTNDDEDENVNKLGRYEYNHSDGKGGYTQHTTVGSYLPNAWGLYDMHGNVLEWCLDWWDDSESWSSDPVTDPVGATAGNYRILRGGSYYGSACNCRSAVRFNGIPSRVNSRYGFRVVLVP
ncbi:formylglycine-generating enzyme family protein, partial [bacterium]|nr:formylglycine-generating enzyme family protein [bacterium]